MFGRVLKYVGFGLVVAGLQDEAIDFSDGSKAILYDCVIALAGLLTWGAGNYLEMRAPAVPQTSPHSTELIKKALRYGAGTGLSCGLVHLSKHTNTNSSAMSDINSGCMLFIAAQELNLVVASGTTKLKWEKLRFAILTIGDYFTFYAGKKLLNREHLDLFSMITLPLGLGMVFGEAAYTFKNDMQPLITTGVRGIDRARKINNFMRVLNKRMIRLTVGLGTIFILQDLIFGTRDKYSIASDAYGLLANFMLFAALMEMRRLAIMQNQMATLQVTLPVAVEEDATAFVRIEEAQEAVAARPSLT
jgi:hypothetical protein